MLKHFDLTEEEYRSLVSEYGGFCLDCREEACGIEPDARNYLCESCGRESVFGAEELLLMGHINIT